MENSAIGLAVFLAFIGMLLVCIFTRRLCRRNAPIAHGLDEEEMAFQGAIERGASSGNGTTNASSSSSSSKHDLHGHSASTTNARTGDFFDLDHDQEVQFDSAQLEQLKLLSNIGDKIASDHEDDIPPLNTSSSASSFSASSSSSSSSSSTAVSSPQSSSSSSASSGGGGSSASSPTDRGAVSSGSGSTAIVDSSSSSASSSSTGSSADTRIDVH